MTRPGRCPVCACASRNSVHQAREMMLGTARAFAYLECAACGALTLQEPPPSMAAYYPRDYYSFHRAEPAPRVPRRAVAGAAMRTVLLHERVARGLARLGRALPARFPAWVSLLSGQGVTTESSVLDVGCGSGHRLRSLRRCGFRNLTGADPFAPPGTELGEGITFLRAPPEEVVGRYDVVMFHHSLEHAPDPLSALRAVRAHLSPDGVVVVRVPLADSFAWRRYRADWVQLDAPRHFLVPSLRAMHLLADKAGCAVTATVHDSDGFQFWGSEQYRRGIALTDPRSHLVDPAASIFSAETLREYERRARRLNAIGDGDQAAFLLRAA